MPNTTKAQSLLEYLIVAVIVIGGIMFGGPFLINSINARFRGMDDTVQDAFSENIKQGPLPAEGTPCTCTDWVDTGHCGNASNGCTPQQMLRERTCSPLGCQTTQDCVNSSACCEDITPGLCGSQLTSDMIAGAVIANYDPYYPPCDSRNAVDPCFTSEYAGTCTGTGTDVACAIGERIYVIAGDPIKHACKTDDTCWPQCYEPNSFSNFNSCNNDGPGAELPHELALRMEETTQDYKTWSNFVSPAANAGAVRVHYKYHADCPPDPNPRKCDRTCKSPAFYICPANMPE
jgi:hypothetical protein